MTRKTGWDLKNNDMDREKDEERGNQLPENCITCADNKDNKPKGETGWETDARLHVGCDLFYSSVKWFWDMMCVLLVVRVTQKISAVKLPGDFRPYQ